MSQPELVEEGDRLVIRSRMRGGMRVLLAALALVPLLAPNELLIQTRWERPTGPFFALVAVISAGAMALSAFLLLAALAGLSSRIVVDRRSRMLTYVAEAPVVRRAGHSVPWSDVEGVEVGVREWSEGAPTYHLAVTDKAGRRIESGSSGSREEIERMRARVVAFMADRDGAGDERIRVIRAFPGADEEDRVHSAASYPDPVTSRQLPRKWPDPVNRRP